MIFVRMQNTLAKMVIARVPSIEITVIASVIHLPRF